MTDKNPLGLDPHSYSNYKEARVKHLHLELRVDFKRKIFHGFVNLTVYLLEEANELLLDAKALAIEKVLDLETGSPLLWTIPKNHESLGFCVRIPLPTKNRNKGSTIKIQIHYSTTPDSGGIQWFEPQQTDGKKHPYVYTQCEAILARTLLPCQDTPSVKSPYSIKVTVPSPLVAACSGTPVREEAQSEDDGWLTWEYNQVIPIPSYLIAVVVGALEKAKIGPRSSVWTEKPLIESCVHEFSADTEKFIKIGEKLTGIPYEWGAYDLVVLPGAFPYGGMENPQLTFLSRSLLAGDRSLTNVVAHEITHSWSGNLVTNASWKDFWLNEGFTVYIERLILGEANSDAYRHFEALIGYNDLIKTINDFGSDSEWTKLQPNMNGIDPDDVFSKVPYEKGSLFLLYLETVVGGKEAMQKWLNKYFNEFKRNSVTTEQMKSHFLNHFNGVVGPEVLKKIDWDHWLNAPGLPSFDPREVLDKSLAEACNQLVKKWKDQEGSTVSPDDLNSFQAKQKMYFLDNLTAGAPLKPETLQKLDSNYSLSSSKNVEILFRWIMLSLKSQDKSIFPLVSNFLSKHGRGLYVRPMYKLLNEVDHTFASNLYKENRSFYHSVIRNIFDPILLK
eukprot:TRINITY_DN270_c0_g1_i1.p1 TRINITY_DN270_c0_g1~~TRINITY_DN270_c0_g1_i1.p1  ORF type:complete len:617 (-),score=117.27 TRINITY_DN270_c0_g1_i1:104-1954(-)